MTPTTPDPTPEERQRAADLRRGAEPPFPAPPVDADKACTLHGAAGCQACQILTLEGELSGPMACLDAVREALALPKGEPAPYGELAGHVEALRKERDDARALLDLAWDKLPEGYTVLRGQIMTALGRQGCTQCGYPCGEEGEGPACVPYP